MKSQLIRSLVTPSCFLLFCTLAFATEAPCWLNIIKSKPVDAHQIKDEIKAWRSDPGIATLKERFPYYSPSEAAKTTVPLKVMTWNVERAGPDLFVPSKEWDRYKKHPDWYNKLWNLKLYMMAQVIALEDPDILFMNEVSWAAIQHLRDAILIPLGYTHFFFDAAGKTTFNGMGNAVFTKAKYPIIDATYGAPQSYGVTINGTRPDTRNILRWQIAVGSRLITFLGVHFRSRIPHSSEESGLRDWKAHHIREQQILLLKEKIREFQAKEAIVVLGDFNGALPGSAELQHNLRIPDKAFENMESEEDNRQSMREMLTANSPTQARTRQLPHNPFQGLQHPTYVYKQFFPIPGTSDTDPDGTKRTRFMPPNEYRFDTDHILIHPGSHHVIEAAENPTVVGPSAIRDEWGNPKASMYRIQEDRIKSFYGPSDHFAKVVTLHINAD